MYYYKILLGVTIIFRVSGLIERLKGIFPSRWGFLRGPVNFARKTAFPSLTIDIV